ncbi:amidohydrolase family protein [Flexivirga alba]|uniref:Amidohydrolase family protein n=1 Tax=Flexivirga alba TaxID=702742 RepID=A0ABW2ADA0_9MICO
MTQFDTHTHAISPDTDRYPVQPLGGTRSEWSQTRAVDIDGLLRSLDAAGVERAALVHASTVYGFDNSYAADALDRHPDRLVGVCAVDFLSPTAIDDLRHWIGERGFSGVRIRVSDGTTAVPAQGSGVSDEGMAAVWDYLDTQHIPVCIQMHSKDTNKLVSVLERHPRLTVLLDHGGRPNAAGGPPYNGLDELATLSKYDGVHLKITPPMLRRLGEEPGVDAIEVVGELVHRFGADHLMWGSNFPASDGTLASLRDSIHSHFVGLTDAQLTGVLGANAARVYTASAAG